MTAAERRLASGGGIDRSRPLRFTFDGRPYRGFEGDTLASALLAEGVDIIGRSFKYHRPRGVIGAGVEDPACLVELAGRAASGNQQAATVRLRDGLAATSVNCWPSPELDAAGIIGAFSRLLPAGFYYKTFMWPGWRYYEPWIRRAAGLAAAPATPAEGRFETRHAHADVLVVGAGPAGLSAALAAAGSGARVVLVDDNRVPGGALLNRRLGIGGAPAEEWAAKAGGELAAMDNVTYLCDATAWGYREHNLVLVVQRNPETPDVIERSWKVRARRVVIATGAHERPLVFANNDRPGAMLASAVQAYVNRYAVLPGTTAVVFTNNDSAYGAAADMAAAGIDVAAIVDSRKDVPGAARALVGGTEILAGQVVTEAHGRRRVRSVSAGDPAGGTMRRIACDLLAHSGGWNPVVHLHCQSRGTLRFDDTIAAFVPKDAAQPAAVAGAAAGLPSLGDALADGAAKGAGAAEAAGFRALSRPLPECRDQPYAVEPLWLAVAPGREDRSFLDILNDVTVDDVRLALREGYRSIEHVKRYTTGGMGFDQGKTGNANIIGTVAHVKGIAVPEAGFTTFRPPYVPVAFGAVAGARTGPVVLPFRHTPVTAWNIEQGAVMYEAGGRWRRPGYFPKPGESFQDSVDRECRSVRQRVGVYDGSPLGKFEIKGRDALRLLDLVYTNDFSDLAPGKGRYGLMLTDDGMILDDGVTFRIDEHRYLMTTSTANAETVNRHLERILQVDRRGWDVRITTLTSEWCNATICGPRARDVMKALATDIDIDRDAFPFMHFRSGSVAGLPARVFRVSFTGEVSFEVNVRRRHFRSLWDRVMDAGRRFGIEPVGSEASHVLRTEKGFLSLGHEADGTVDPHDLGMSWIMSRKKADFIGKRAVEIRRSSGEPRRELVGLLPDDPEQAIPEGAPLTPGGSKRASEGLTTACVRSVVNDRWIALALLENGRERIGGTAHARTRTRIIPARIAAPCFHDPEGRLLRG